MRQTVRYALNVLAEAAPTRLLAHAEPEWAERSRRGWDDERLPSQPAERDALIAPVGAAGLILLRAAAAPDAPPELASLPALQILRPVWIPNSLPTEDGVRWRTADDG